MARRNRNTTNLENEEDCKIVIPQIYMNEDLLNEFSDFEKNAGHFCYKSLESRITTFKVDKEEDPLHCSCDNNVCNLHLVSIYDKKVVIKAGQKPDLYDTRFCYSCKFFHDWNPDLFIILCINCVTKHKRRERLDVYDSNLRKAYNITDYLIVIKKCNNRFCTFTSDQLRLLPYDFELNYPKSTSAEDKYLCKACYEYSKRNFNQESQIHYCKQLIIINCIENLSKFCYPSTFIIDESTDKDQLEEIANSYACKSCLCAKRTTVQFRRIQFEASLSLKIRNYPIDSTNLSSPSEVYQLCNNVFKNESFLSYANYYLQNGNTVISSKAEFNASIAYIGKVKLIYNQTVNGISRHLNFSSPNYSNVDKRVILAKILNNDDDLLKSYDEIRNSIRNSLRAKSIEVDKNSNGKLIVFIPFINLGEQNAFSHEDFGIDLGKLKKNEFKMLTNIQFGKSVFKFNDQKMRVQVEDYVNELAYEEFKMLRDNPEIRKSNQNNVDFLRYEEFTWSNIFDLFGETDKIPTKLN